MTESVESLVDAVFAEATTPSGGYYSFPSALSESPAGAKLLAQGREDQAAAVGLLLERLDVIAAELGQQPENRMALDYAKQAMEVSLYALLRRKLPLSESTVIALLRWISSTPRWGGMISYAGVASAVENMAAEAQLSDALQTAVRAATDRLQAISPQRQTTETRKTASRLFKLAPTARAVRLNPGEVWADAAIADLDAMSPERRKSWEHLLAACQDAPAGKPPAKWFKEVKPLIETIGRDDLKEKLRRWLPLVDKPKVVTQSTRHVPDVVLSLTIEPHHADILKGLAWCAGLETDRDLARVLGALAISAYRKLPGQGPRLISLGNAAVASLGMMPGMDAVGQLAILKLKVKFIPAQKAAEKALEQAAAREGLPREEIDELAVPAYGLEEVGRRVETLGEYTAEILVDGPDAHLHWSKAGKPLKSVPAAAKKEHAEEVKELQAVVKDVGKMLTAQRDRIDNLFLSQKTWTYSVWRERYLDHPLIGAIARRLIWTFETDDRNVAGAWLNDGIVGVDDAPIEGLGESTKVALWHPIDREVSDVTAWRDWFDRHQIRQPFKQAYREVYLLTDAERNTRTYSNRFAAHVLRQHQYHALCAARGWRNRLRLMVDDSYPATHRDLPEWGLRAEFWVEGAGDDYGRDTTDSGAYLHLATDQVRFYEIAAPQLEAHAGGGGYSGRWNQADAEPVLLERIPPLVLSEIFRDVDLFVGVASVGNDPNWADGGPDGRHQNYWQSYSFGDLSANGNTRKAVLERLIPRLKIADRCSFADRFLVVRGDLRTYKIHLGSGNILMEPTDQYLCIVPKQSLKSKTDDVFLPFEGDNVLSIILSKALMLADDRKITDSTITSQIHRK